MRGSFAYKKSKKSTRSGNTTKKIHKRYEQARYRRETQTVIKDIKKFNLW